MGLFNKEIKNENKVTEETTNTIETKICKRLYLVDYENVSDAGLVGVNQLTKGDIVVIFYGSKVKTVAYETLIAITSSAASIEHMKAEKTAKNYLDFQLTTYLGYKLGQNSIDEIYVITKDSGFDAVVDFWGERGYTIKRQPSIIVEEKVNKENPEETTEESPKAKTRRTYTRRTGNQSRPTTRSTRPKVVTKPQPKKPRETANRPTVTEKQKAELRAALKGAELSAPDYKKVYDAFASCDNSSAYNNMLQKSLGNDKTSVVYKATSKFFENTHK